MSDLENVKINAVSCSTCVHNQVCSYKEDFIDVCNAVLNANVDKHEGDGKMRIKNVTKYDFLDEIVIKCKHYYNGSKIRIDSNGMTLQPYPNHRDYSTVSVASENPNSVTTMSNATKAKIDPPSTLETTTDYIFR